jgi:hypothetical protein
LKNANPNHRERDLPGSLVLFPHLGTRRCVVFLILVRRMNGFPIRCTVKRKTETIFPSRLFVCSTVLESSSFNITIVCAGLSSTG